MEVAPVVADQSSVLEESQQYSAVVELPQDGNAEAQPASLDDSSAVKSDNTQEIFSGDQPMTDQAIEAQSDEQQQAQEMLDHQLKTENDSETQPLIPASELPTWNIFVGDLNKDVTEDDLRQTFSACGPIASVHIFREPRTQEHKGFGFVHFADKAGQEKAVSAEFRNVAIKGRPSKVSISEQKNTLFIGNLPSELNQEGVRAAIEEIVGKQQISGVELKTGPPPAYESRGFCFVQFINHQLADAGRKKLVNASIKNRPLNVSWAENRNTQMDEETMAKIKTLYVSNISVTVTEQVLQALFGEHGQVVNTVIVKVRTCVGCWHVIEPRTHAYTHPPQPGAAGCRATSCRCC
eukprot:TRINITY_DN6387_c0_g1_i2.p1 TRINITY_DN6387_c0_g1~~TRINITY_DN6387_c0_g1_i2.p1  ORF type:complete len:351 (+),score=72.59 TRINITY_DN6387_c0_g1_i2:145-1197(+)